MFDVCIHLLSCHPDHNKVGDSNKNGPSVLSIIKQRQRTTKQLMPVNGVCITLHTRRVFYPQPPGYPAARREPGSYTGTRLLSGYQGTRPKCSKYSHLGPGGSSGNISIVLYLVHTQLYSSEKP